MEYPEHLLASDETVEAAFRPHWQVLTGAVAVELVGIALAVVAARLRAPGWAVVAILVAAILVALPPLIRWLTTHYVVTSRRIIHRTGLVARRGKEIPLEVINDIAFSQSVFERIVGSGDLLIESAGTQGQTRFTDIPDPETIQQTIYEARERRRRGPASAPPPSDDGRGVGIAAEIAALARLRDAGDLTAEEFERQKRRLLGEP